MSDTRKQAILYALRLFVQQRPGMEPGNYGDWKAYRSELRQVTRDKHDAERLLRELELRDSITADDILSESGDAGRLTFSERTMRGTDIPARVEVSYTAGQYFATEYRKAVARLAAAVLWAHVREHGMPAPQVSEAQCKHYMLNNRPVSAGDWLRAYFKREFGRHLAERYFT